MLSINAYSMMDPMSKMSSMGFLSPNRQSPAEPSSVFTNFIVNSKPYEQYMKSAATGVSNFLNSMQKMQESAQKLLQKEESPLQAMTAESSDSKKVTAAASSGAEAKTYAVKVDAIATSQKNSGSLLSGKEASAVNKGFNELEISVGGKTTKVSTVISSSDTNDQALTKLKDAVNAAKTGVTASIVTDKDTGNKKLELTSDKTGTNQAFTVKDVTGNAVAATGVQNATQQASNAAYSVNGGATQTSQSNTIDLEKGKVTATLKASSTEAVNIQVKSDDDKVISQVKQLVSNYNEMYGRLKEAGGTMNSSIRKNLDSIVDSSLYERVGIQQNSDGTLKLDEEKLKKSLSTNFDQTAKAISGKYGLADRLSSAADKYNDAPTSSLLNQKARQTQQSAFYQSSMQMAMNSHVSGLLVNMLY